jgi:tRNA U34 5-methylaminomethyl-2-thiouridine-forming methyltransferase MnmC
MKKVKTRDSSYTYYNEKVGDYYHSLSGAREESFEKHAKPSKVSELKKGVIFDICFGLGYNTKAAIELFKGTSLTIYCFENDREILGKIEDPLLTEFLEKGELVYNNVKLILMFGDFRSEIKKVNEKADIVFFDAFDPKKVPELWEESVFKLIYDKMNSKSVLTTYSYARKVKDNLASAGFTLKDGPIVGRRSPSTIAYKQFDL